MWSSIGSGDSALIIVGAGYPIGVLGTDAPPSTNNILQEAANTNEYPIIEKIVSSAANPKLSLNKLWSNISHFIQSIIHAFPEIFEKYKLLDSSKFSQPSMTKYIEKKSSDGLPPIDILCIGLGLELKKVVSHFYSGPNKNNLKNDKLQHIQNILKNYKKRYWVSLNYDLVLEESLLKMRRIKTFNSKTQKIRYLNEELVNKDLNNPKVYSHSQDTIIKPHGSINLCFKTLWNNCLNELYYLDINNYLTPFNYQEIGYEKISGEIIEKRPCIIGYVPEDDKDELNSKSYYSDIAHDFCKAQMASIIFAMNEVKTIFILGYSMPDEDEWVWKRIKDIRYKDKNIYICSRSSSNGIKKRFKDAGFTNIKIVNKGKI